MLCANTSSLFCSCEYETASSTNCTTFWKYLSPIVSNYNNSDSFLSYLNGGFFKLQWRVCRLQFQHLREQIIVNINLKKEFRIHISWSSSRLFKICWGICWYILTFFGLKSKLKMNVTKTFFQRAKQVEVTLAVTSGLIRGLIQGAKLGWMEPTVYRRGDH